MTDNQNSNTLQLAAIAEAMTTYLKTDDWQAASAKLLSCAIQQTHSEYGFVGVVVNQTLRVLAHEGIQWSQYTGQEIYQQAVETYRHQGYLEFTSFNNLFGSVITSKSVVIANTPATDPRAAKKMPAGHPALNTFLGVPIYSGNDVVGMIGIANRPEGYSKKEQTKLETLTSATGVLYDSYRRKEREKALERQLQNTQRLETIGTLAGGIAHDFNNLLTPMIGFVDLTRDELPADSPAVEYLEHVLAGALRAKELVEQILAFSRQSEEPCAAIDLPETLMNAINLLRGSLPATVDIHSEIHAGHNAIIATPAQIYQLILNLGKNAFDALVDESGCIEISLERITTSEHSPDTGLLPLTGGNYHCLTVRDNGRGIAPEILDRVFDPFFTTKAVGQGTGLGLSVVHGIAKDLRGCVTLSSQINKGTSVSVYLPESDQGMAESNTDIPCIAGKGHILVVDDEKPIIELLEVILQKQGYRVTTTDQSMTALSLIRDAPERFDLVITDKTMPSLSGLDLIETLYNEGIKIPTILMTGYFQDGDEIHHPGVSRYLKKPLDIQQFNVAVAECISTSLNTSSSNNE